jgi:hypothetical protein
MLGQLVNHSEPEIKQIEVENMNVWRCSDCHVLMEITEPKCIICYKDLET